MDTAKSGLAEDEMFFSLNNDIINPDAQGRNTPLPSNYLGCDIELPEGDNYRLGSYYSELTNETYVVVGNTNNAHFIYRTNGDGTCEIVNDSPCLQSVLGTLSEGVFDPKHALEDWRIKLRVEKICTNRHGKELIFTNGLGNIACIDVEASIATDSFTTDFFDVCPHDCETVELCVPQPCECITAEFLQLPEDEIGITNKIVDVGFKFIYRHVYYDLRTSEWSIPSSLYYQDSKGCFSNTEGFPRCLELTIPLGNPLVDKIEVGYSTDGGINWVKDAPIEKYESYTTSVNYWYERNISSALALTEDGCHFKFKFCNDGQCVTIPPGDIRPFNPLPRQPQGFIDIKEVEGYYNFIQGTCPVSGDEIDKGIITANCFTSGGDCDVEFAKVKVRLVIHNLSHDRNQFIYRMNGGSDNAPDDETDTAYFGGLNPSLNGGWEGGGYDQYFNEKTRNFIVYIDGTDYWAEMKQYKSDEFFSGNFQEWGVLPHLSDVNTRNRWRRASRNGEFFYQEAEIRVKKGTKGFLRMSSHHSTGNTQSTSTFVLGVLDNIYAYKGDGISSYDGATEEIYFDTCDGDFETEKTFLVIDNAVDSGFAKKATGFFGYIKDANGKPVEGAIVSPYDGVNDFSSTYTSTTDHNGFFHLYVEPNTSLLLSGSPLLLLLTADNADVTFQIRVEQSCVGVFTSIQTFVIQGTSGTNTGGNSTITSTDYRDNFFANVDASVVDCDGNGVGGITVSMSGSKSQVTNGSGIAEFKLRNYNSRDREIRAVVMDGKGCFTQDCDNVCNPCMPTVTYTTPACYDNGGTPIDIVLSDMEVSTDDLFLQSRGLKKGGRYIFALMGEGDCGRISAAYPLKNGEINIPKLQDNSQTEYCSFSYNFTGMALPEWMTCLRILRTINLNPFELQWIVDKVERTTTGKIKLTIQSLNDYNASFFFKTNTVYKYLENDRVEFIKNGDGSIFTTAEYGLLNFQALSPFNDTELSDNTDDVDYFNQLLIDDDSRLEGLEKGAIIEIQRAKECETEPTYYSICVSLDVVDGQVVEQTGTFTTFDTYLVTRNIGEFNQQVFEHHSPSDFWGERLSDIGRAYFANKYENERRYGRSVILNGAKEFNRFDSKLIKTFDAPEQGDITGMNIVDGQVILAIGENDSLTAQVSDTLLRVGSDGLARAASPDQIISDGEPKLSGQYGCKYNSIGSIYFGDGFATFIDIFKSAYIKHNYNLAEDVSEGKVKSYFRKRCTQIQLLNAQAGTNYINHYRFVTGQNQQNKSLYLTIKKLSETGVNNSQAAYIKNNETQIFHPIANEWLGMAAFTPEGYSRISLFDEKGCSFISYQNALPYITPIIPETYLEFFGETTDWVIGVSMNKNPLVIKRGLTIEVQDAKALWYVSKVETEVANWVSEIPPIKAVRNEDMVSLSFLANSNSRGGLYGDDMPRGYSHSVTLIRNNTDELKYGTTSDATRKIYSELGYILFKFVESYLSGNANLNQ